MVHSPDDIIEEVREDISNWHLFGDDLGVSSTDLDRIKAEQPTELQKLMKTVRIWYDNHHNDACWEDVVKAIAKMGNKRLAKKVADKHGVQWKGR